MNLHASFFWRKLDHPGHDSCRLFKLPKGWFANGVEQDNVAGCLDLDLGFTPATNLFAIRRLSLKVGQRA